MIKINDELTPELSTNSGDDPDRVGAHYLSLQFSGGPDCKNPLLNEEQLSHLASMPGLIDEHLDGYLIFQSRWEGCLEATVTITDAGGNSMFKKFRDNFRYTRIPHYKPWLVIPYPLGPGLYTITLTANSGGIYRASLDTEKPYFLEMEEEENEEDFYLYQQGAEKNFLMEKVE